MRAITTLGAAAALLATGCVNTFGSAEHELGHDHHEMTSSFDELAAWEQDGDWLVSPALEAPDGASRVGALFSLVAPGELPVVEARALEGGEPIGEWIALGASWSEEDQHVALAELGTVGDGAQLRVRVDSAATIQILRWTAVIPEPVEVSDDPDAELGLSAEPLRAELRGLGIVTRDAWGARATRCTSGDSRKTRFAVHHTVTGSSDPARQMRGIQRFHMDTRGWCDVGYHFLIGSNGQIFEGRPLHLLGAHVGGHNTGNIGVSFIGCYHTSGCGGLGPTTPSDVSVRNAGRLIGTLRRLYGVGVSTSTIKGHRDHSGQGTSCPGNNLHSRLGTIRSVASTQTLSSSSTPAPAPSDGDSCLHTYGGRYSDGACSGSYQCCDGRWRSGTGVCGACVCRETTGTRGCSAPSGPPPGASCTHTYGGRYANTACSASYQCCNGSWRSGTGVCGACYCTETTGTRGCGT